MEYLPPPHPDRMREDSLYPRDESLGFYRTPYAEQPVPGPDELGRWLEYLRILGRHKFLILAMTILCGLAGFLISLLQTPIYRARTTLEIQGFQEPLPGVVPTTTSEPFVATQVQILMSQTLHRRVLSKLEPEKQSLQAPFTDPLASLRRSLGLSSSLPEWEEAIKLAKKDLKVAAIKDSQIIEVVCESTFPRLTAGYVNQLTAAFVEQNQEERWEAYQKTGDWLSRAQEDLKKKLEESEQKLLNYTRSEQLLFTSEEANVAEQKLKQIQEELSKARAELVTKESIYKTATSRPPESLPAVLDYGPMVQYQVKLADLRRELAELSTSLTPANPKIARLNAQIAELESIQAKERTNILARVKNEYESALGREKQLEADFKLQSKLVLDQAEKLIQYKILKREVDTDRALYETALQKGKEASIASALRPSKIRVIDPAGVPVLPYKPDLILNLGIGLIGGLCFTSCFVVIRGRISSTIQAPGFLGPYLNIRELGAIPSAKTDPDTRALTKRRSGHMLGNSRLRAPSDQPVASLELASWGQKMSMMAESYRAVMTSLLCSQQNGNHLKALLVTSPSPQEGKSTTISNLGIALAEIKRRVILIDADLRRPRLHSVFSQENDWGLSDLLREGGAFDEYPGEALVRETDIPGLYLLPSGPGGLSTSRMLYSNRMSDLLCRLKQDFDVVLIDSAPVLVVPDTRILARLSDGVILVCRAGRTPRDAVIAAANFFQEDHTPVVGTILTDWNPRIEGYGYYGHSYYSHYSQSRTER